VVPDATKTLCQQFGIDLPILAKVGNALQALTALGKGEGQLLAWQKGNFVTLLAVRQGAWEERFIGRTRTVEEEPFAFRAFKRRRFVRAEWGLVRGAEPLAHYAIPLPSLPLLLTLDIPLTDIAPLSLWQCLSFPRSLVRRIAATAWEGVVPSEVLVWVLSCQNGVAIWDEKGRLRWSVGEIPPLPDLPDGLTVGENFVGLRTRAGKVVRRWETLSPFLRGYALLRSEVHHRVKNDLQSVVSWLRWQARTASPEAKAILLSAAERVRVFATVHDLLARARGEAVPLRELIQQLAQVALDQAQREGKALRFALIGPEVILAPQQASAIAAAIHELLRNACEHAFPPGSSGTITVQLERTEKSLRLSVADDGRGFDPHRWDRASLGLTIVRNLVEQDLRGKVEIWSEKGCGTTVLLEFPLTLV